MDLKDLNFVERYDSLKKIESSIMQLTKHLSSEHNRLSTIEWFIQSKLSLVKKGMTAEMGEFDLQFRQTQMVEQYLPPR